MKMISSCKLNSSIFRSFYRKTFVSSLNSLINQRYTHTSDNYSTILSLQPLGGLHLGHYFSSIKPSVNVQNTGGEIMICIADLLSLTKLPNREVMSESILLNAATLMACGVDPAHGILFQQSQVCQHSQLDWILHCIINLDDPIINCLNKFPTKREVLLGEYVSPLLTCSDYLLYNMNIAPVDFEFGEQLQLFAKCAKNFSENHNYQLKIPEPKKFASKICSLRKPTERMSRSEIDTKSRIELLDSPATIIEKCKKAVTDFTSDVYFDLENRPGVSNLMTIHSLVSGKNYEIIEHDSIGMESAQYKLIVADAIINYLQPIQQKANILMKDKSSLWLLLDEGAVKARNKAEATIQSIYETIGFIPPLKSSTNSVPFSASNTIQYSSSLEPSEINSPNTLKKQNKVIFSGIQPTGIIHLGNYFGAVKQWIEYQESDHDITVCVVDQHAITMRQSPQMLYSNILDMTASLIACGVDPNRSCLFQQSRVPQHAQLYSILRSITHVTLLSRQAHYKDKVSVLEGSPSLGLFSYPVLQAADILLYQATHVPVGDDQKQHIQVARHIARTFNKCFGEFIFCLPKAIILDDSLARLKSLCQPAKKMSKSEMNPNSRIEILDSPESIVLKCKDAVVNCSQNTALNKLFVNNSILPVGLDNLVAMHSIVTGLSSTCISSEYGALDVAAYKIVVADSVVEHLQPIRRRALHLLQDKVYLAEIMNNGAEKAKFRAQKTMQIVHKQVGFSSVS